MIPADCRKASDSGGDRHDNLRQCLNGYFEAGFPDETTSLSELELDSLELIEILFTLEQFTGRWLSNRELAALSTVGELLDCFAFSEAPGEIQNV